MNKTITEEIYQKARDSFMATAYNLRNLGIDDSKIQDYFDKVLRVKLDEFYEQERKRQHSMPMIMQKCFENIGERYGVKKKSSDSYAEVIFSNLLKENNIPFEFQVNIGPYRVDYLINDFLIFEGDGEQHDLQINYDMKRDSYLEKLGYEVLRCKWKMVAYMQDEIIEAIKSRILNV